MSKPSPESLISAPWWPELLAMKDAHGWAALTKRFGVSESSLRAALAAAGVSKAPAPAGRRPAPKPDAPAATPGDPLAAFRARVGNEPDAAIAAAAGVTPDAVKAWRAAHGIAPYRRPPPGRAAPADATPTAVEKAAGTRLVRRRTSGEGKVETVVVREAPVSAAPVSAAPASSPLDAFRDRLGKEADGTIAAEAGVDRRVVVAYRATHGIPAYDGFRFKKRTSGAEAAAPARKPARASAEKPAAAAKPPRAAKSGAARPAKAAAVAAPASAPASSASRRPMKHRRSKLDAYAHLVGIRSDGEIAKLAGVTSTGVRLYRRRHGIPAARPTPAERVAAPPIEALVASPPVDAPAPKAEAAPAAAKVPAKAEAPEAEAPAATRVDAAPAAQASAPSGWRRAWRIVATNGGDRVRFVILAEDVRSAIDGATAALASRDGGPWVVASARDVGEGVS